MWSTIACLAGRHDMPGWRCCGIWPTSASPILSDLVTSLMIIGIDKLNTPRSAHGTKRCIAEAGGAV
jgi:hypothetical protein